MTGPAVELFRRIYGRERIPVLLFSLSGRILAANAGFLTLSDRSEPVPAGTRTGELLPELDENRVAALAQDVLAGRKLPRLRHTTLRTAAGASPTLDLQLFMLRDEGGAAQGMVAHCIDTTEDAAPLRSAEAAATDPRTTEAHIRASMEASRIAPWSIVPETGETWFGDMWHRLLGFSPGAFAPSFDAFIEMMHPEDRPATVAAFEDLAEGRTDHFRADFRLRRADGGWCWIGASGGKVDRSSQRLPYLICGVQMDITRRKTTEEQLSAAARDATEHRERLNRLAEDSPAALFEFRIDTEGRVTLPYLSGGVMELMAVTPADLERDGADVFRNIVPEDEQRMIPEIEESRTNLKPFKFRYRVDHPQRGQVWIQANSVPKRLEDGSTTWVGSLYDVSQEVAREQELQEARDAALEMQQRMGELALRDGLTGLPNRRHFDIHLEERKSRQGRCGGAPAAILVRMDLDHFKFVNDTLGHAAGDAVLRHVAQVLKRNVAKGDFASRVGGDEFSIIMAEGGRLAHARALVERLQQDLRRPFLFNGQTCRFGASFGIATTDQGRIADGELLSFADVALYQAKKRGRNRQEVFDKTLHHTIIENRRLATEIERALERGEFVPYFQPQVCAASGALVGLETLARWFHPERGLLSPDSFMPVAEQIRVVPLIDRMMLEKTQRILGTWRTRGFLPPKVSFNVSAGRLRDADMVGAARRLQQKGVDVAFELLESILVEQEDDIFRFNLAAAKDAGIMIEIDDFGSGHASIIGLMEAAPSMLKIDRRLSGGAVDSAQVRQLIASIIQIGRALDIRTTVEGVETERQAEVLRELGCHVLQGFLYLPPVDHVSLASWALGRGAVPGGRTGRAAI